MPHDDPEVARVVEELYGPDDERRRRIGDRPGLVMRVTQLEEDVRGLTEIRRQAEAVVSAKRWLIGFAITVGSMLLGMIGTMVQVLRLVSDLPS